ncbi:hypothetical protein [Xanthomonas oryzae]|uniref:hypothetical protein n=1 Tax=Xanthomonas oryzae TaxID=347 RepID=UPI000A598073|nr:hypothetical protein [Xanthomonas oryzae]
MLRQNDAHARLHTAVRARLSVSISAATMQSRWRRQQAVLADDGHRRFAAEAISKTHWMFLALAICMENTAAAALNSNDGFTRA